MSKLSIPTLLATLCGSAVLTACPSDDTTATGTETESSSSSTGPMVTTVSTTMNTTMDQTTTSPDTTVGLDDTTSTGPDDTTSTGPDDTTSTGPDDTTTTGESTTTGGSSESSSSGEPPPMDGYGDCANFADAEACLPDEVCVDIPDSLGLAVCMQQGCLAPGDCSVPTTGTAVPSCEDLAVDPMNECYLDCGMGEICPDGMVCALGFLCLWALLPGDCPDQDLGSTVPQSVMGNNGLLGNDHDPSCGIGSGPPGGADAMYQFTAMAAGTYVFDTAGSSIDTILSILDGCGGMELDCNDDVGGGPVTSEITIMLAAGQSVIIVVEGYSGLEGPITLNIDQV